MKFMVCFLIVIANISNNGKASLESFAPTGTNVLLADTTKSTDTSCYRPCKFKVKPRRCYYKFKIEPTIQEDGKTAITINGLSPGPSILVCMNDIIVVEVQNKIPDQDLSIHWHGLEQKGTPYMDGVPMVTQCPIGYGTTYKYAFRASSPGTYFYHADSVLTQTDGVYGSLIINQPQPMEPHASLYDYDRSIENTLIIGAKFPEILSGNLDDLSLLKPENIVINGDNESYKIFVIPGFAYRLRLINAIAVSCPLDVSVDDHEALIIATDGKPVMPVLARKVRLYSGERMDIVVRAAQKIGGYWIRVRGDGVCADLRTNAMMIYSGYNYTSMLKTQAKIENLDQEPTIPVTGNLLSYHQPVPPEQEVRTVYLGIDRNIFNETSNDFRYISDAHPSKPFFPAALSLKKTGVIQINKKSFLYPNAPLLLSPHNVHPASLCAVGSEVEHQDPQCVQVLNTRVGEVLDIALVNEGFGSNESYTFHMHGHSVQVLATWQNPENMPVGQVELESLDKDGKISRNLKNPPFKDTITVPNKGFTIVRLRPDHGGTWLLECRSCAFSSLPTAIIVNVPQVLPKSISDSLPKCGNYRPPDVLLN